VVFAPYKADAVLQLYSGGLGASLLYYPVSRLLVRADTSLGLYAGLADKGNGSSWWWRGGGEAGFRFSPLFTLSAHGGYQYYHNRATNKLLYSGIYAGLTVQFAFETNRVQGDIAIVLGQDEPVFPIFQSVYQIAAGGTIFLTNRESAEIRNVRVSFRAGNYTSSEFPCETIPFIAKQRTVEVPLLADFSSELLQITEDGRILGEVVIRYTLLGVERQAVHSVSVQVYNRNSFRWMDSTALAAFVSPTAPEILETAKYFTGLARTRARTGLNQNFQFGAYLFEGLLAAGIRNSSIPESPYAEHRGDAETLDTIWFPSQTLSFRAGDLDDLGLLYAACLEAVGIRAAVLPLNDEFITALSLGINETQAAAFVNVPERLLVYNDEAWLPLAMSAFPKGFTAAWDAAAARLIRIADTEAVEFIVLEDAWATYPPAAIPPEDFQFAQPSEARVADAADKAIKAYIDRELPPLIAAMQRRLRETPTAALYNQLGILQIRSGAFADARSSFERAAGMNYAPAMVNMGNLLMLDRDFNGAESWYKRVLALDEDNRAANRGLEQIREERE
jgi:tetratricopeptide (TPR) repeat protein